MADQNGIMDNAKNEFADIGKWFAPACKFFPAGFIFCFLFGGNIFKALGFIGAVYIFTILPRFIEGQIKSTVKRRKRRVRK